MRPFTPKGEWGWLMANSPLAPQVLVNGQFRVNRERSPGSRLTTAIGWHMVVVKYKSVVTPTQTLTQDEALLCSAQPTPLNVLALTRQRTPCLGQDCGRVGGAEAGSQNTSSRPAGSDAPRPATRASQPLVSLSI